MISKNKTIALLILLLLLFCVSLFLEVLIVIFTINSSSRSQTNDDLQKIIQRVNEDIRYINGKWDTSLYNADSDIPEANPLYVITSDGFVIERWKPIKGLLDVSEFARLLVYDHPETITTITNENWRIVSQPIKSKERVVGVITVAAYKPEQNNLVELDQELINTLHDINAKLEIKGDSIDVSKIDGRQIPYNITFQIVNHFNKLLIHNDNTSSISRSPSFIDSSYVDNQLKNKKQQEVTDTESHIKYLVITKPMYDSQKNIVGIIVAGAPINRIYARLYQNLSPIIIYTSLQFLMLTVLLLFVLNKYTQSVLNNLKDNKTSFLPEKIFFNKEKCQLIIDNFIITVPYASYQYYFCDKLLSKPKKRWETDELIEKFGDQPTQKSWRKIYDAMTALNKKTSSYLNEKLFVIQDKTFKVNPLFTSKIQST